MSYRSTGILLSAAALSLSFSTFAGTPIPAQIPVASFATHSQLAMPRLSPDGKYLALRIDDRAGDQHALAVYRVDDMRQAVSMLRMPKYEVPVQITWVSPTRLIVAKGRQMGSIDKPYATGEIIATDYNGKNQDYLFGHESRGKRSDTRSIDNAFGSIDGLPEPANGHFYLSSQGWANRNSSLYDINADSGARHLIGDIDINGMNFMVGPDGKAHYAYGTTNDYEYVAYHYDGNRWGKLGSDAVGQSFIPIRFAPDHKRIYAYYNPPHGTSELIEEDQDGANRKVLAHDEFGNIGNILWTAMPEQPFATVASTGVPKAVYLDPKSPSSKLHLALSQQFNGFVDFIDYSEDGKKLLFSVSSDRDPGTYYLIDTTTFKVAKLFSAEEWVDPSQMAERRPVQFTASDGTKLEAILTLPAGRSEKNLPMVLLPHGGPHGVQDDWYYDTDAQFLANRGYLVLQVNYRGSGGRGADFKEAGYLKWGTRIQQDLIDGVKWAISNDYADPKRICVYGASFGGYSAMMTVIRAPNLFQCAVGYAGVYDLAMMYKKGDIRQSKWGRSYLSTVIGKDDAALDANSPDKLADKITVPVFLIHGEDDQRAPFSQAKAMRAALDAAHKPYEWLSKPGEGHGFYTEENNIEFYNRLQAFLEKHIGKGA
ncbi:MAG: S9 family peptidase [Rhodanobacter sp.]